MDGSNVDAHEPLQAATRSVTPPPHPPSGVRRPRRVLRDGVPVYREESVLQIHPSLARSVDSWSRLMVENWGGTAQAKDWLAVNPERLTKGLAEAPESVKAVVVFAGAEEVEAAKAAVQGLAAVPVVVVLNRELVRGGSCDKFVVARQLLQSTGVHALLMCPNLCDLEMEVDKCLIRCEHHQQAEAAALQELRSRNSEARETQEVQEIQQKDRLNTTFFCVVHRFLLDFPRMNYACKDVSAVEVQVDGYTLKAKLNAGSFPEVYAGTSADGAGCIAKCFSKGNMFTIEDVHKVWSEAKFLRQMDHPTIVRLRAAMHTREEVILILEDCGRLKVSDVVEQRAKLLPSEVQPYARQLLQAIAYIHDREVAHRNICFGSLCVVEGQLKIIGWGKASRLSKKCKQECGTIPFMAPEVLAAGGEYSAGPADLWSVGIVLVEMLCGIGSVLRVLGWSSKSSGLTKQAQHTALASMLISCFAGERSIRDFLASAECAAPEELILLLQRLLTVHVAKRWKAQQAATSSWITDYLD